VVVVVFEIAGTGLNALIASPYFNQVSVDAICVSPSKQDIVIPLSKRISIS